jgi:uncharacterized phiE125 gp8 family phage protein
MHEHLRLDLTGSPPSHPEDATIALRVAAATDEIDAGDGWLGRALLPQQWRVTFNGFPCQERNNPDAAIFLPYPPLISVDAVRYRNTSNTLTTLVAGTDYEVIQGDPHGMILPAFQTPWPPTSGRVNAVEVTFTCGYDEDASPPNPVPDLAKQFIMVCAGTMYEVREDVSLNLNVNPVEQFRNALKTLRVYGP